MSVISRLVFPVLIASNCYAADLSSATNTPVPTITVDNEHYLVHSSHPTTTGLFYNIPGSPKLFIDTTHYAFDMPGKLHGKPLTEICLTRLPDVFMYLTAWERGKTRYELSKATLQPCDGMPPFAGFKPGETWIVMIDCAGDEPGKRSIVWMGRVEIH